MTTTPDSQPVTVLDADGDQNVDYAGPDRISKSDFWYEEDGSGDWWQVSASAVYAQESGSAATTTSVTRTRLTGLSTNLTSETLAIDIHENTNRVTTAVDRESVLETRTVEAWDSTNDALTVTLNGLLVNSETSTGVAYTYVYDGLRRRTSVVDPKFGGSLVVYRESGLVDCVYDAASNKTSFAYDSAGRRSAVTNALGNVARYELDPEGRLLRTWGDVPYPVGYLYDDYNRMTNMTTYRSGTGWDGESWPASPPTGDDTSWLYDEATGLLTNKVYADGNGPTYSYTTDGKLSVRTWARGETTAYSYDGLNQLTNINYSATNTVDISFLHDRLGRRTNVVDALGTRTFAYDPDDLRLSAETNSLGSLVRSYDTHGRGSGLSLDGDYSVAYGYGEMGRPSTVGWGSYTATYSYAANSDLVSGYDIPVGASTFSAARTFEENRALVATVSNLWDTTSVSSYAYQNDAVGRRTQRIDGASVTNDFGYNGRNELVSADMGTNEYGYVYDPIGNRTAATNNAEDLAYLANQLNQYTNVAGSATNAVTYDEDGNILTYNGWGLTWNGENRLIEATNADHAVSFAYDYVGRRVRKVADGVTNTFAYDGWCLLRERKAAAPIDFDNYTLQSYGGQDLSGTATVEDSGLTLKLVGNRWKKISYSYTLTTNTVIEFDFRSGAQGEIHGVAFDDDDTISSDKTFQLYGTQNWGIDSNRTYSASAPDWKHYKIAVGSHYTGAMTHLAFIMDHDAGATGESYFRNVRVYESSAPVRTNDYVWGLDLSGSMQGAGTIGGLLVADLGGTVVLYSYDANGNVTGLTGTNGSAVAEFEYDPYGGTVLAEDSDSSGTVNGNPFRFSTKYLDGETGLLYYGFRYHSPELGRWVSRDPIGESGGQNVYSCTMNDFVNVGDYLGLYSIYIGFGQYHNEKEEKTWAIWGEVILGLVVKKFAPDPGWERKKCTLKPKWLMEAKEFVPALREHDHVVLFGHGKLRRLQAREYRKGHMKERGQFRDDADKEIYESSTLFYFAQGAAYLPDLLRNEDIAEKERRRRQRERDIRAGIDSVRTEEDSNTRVTTLFEKGKACVHPFSCYNETLMGPYEDNVFDATVVPWRTRKGPKDAVEGVTDVSDRIVKLLRDGCCTEFEVDHSESWRSRLDLWEQIEDVPYVRTVQDIMRQMEEKK